ncbi:MAG: phosphopentomutase [Lachnospirales bacterium]
MYNRIITVVMDSLGVGEMEDSKDFGDVNVNTAKHIAEKCNGLNCPNLESLGFGRITEIQGIEEKYNSKALVGKLGELSNGKDTMTGHWEIMGLKTIKPFITFTDTGFPEDLLKELSERSGRKIVGNKAASGTEIIEELGEHHMKTGDLIVYTSADSVLQIAAHEDIISIEEQYKICEIARDITMRDQWKLGRIIARPFIGTGKGDFTRTPNRHDYALKPFEDTVLNYLKDDGFDVISVGKINDIFNTEGITASHKTKSNKDGMEKTIEITNGDFKGLLFTNLVDFDALYGHRRNPEGYGKCIEEFDQQLGELLEVLRDDDLLILTADHGNDPTYKGSDHTREYIPIVMYSKSNNVANKLYTGNTFANIGATIADNFNTKMPKYGESYINEMKI